MDEATPLEIWLQGRGIPQAKAAETCARHKCLGAYTTLLRYPFTLPELALQVARALGIPAEEAAPLGRALVDRQGWKADGVSEPKPINFNPEWHRQLRRGAAPDEGEMIHLNVVALQRIVELRGGSYEAWLRENLKLYNACRATSHLPKTTLRHVQTLADTLRVPQRALLTHIQPVAEQRKALSADGLSLAALEEAWQREQEARQAEAARAAEADDSLTEHCAIDVERLGEIIREKGLTRSGFYQSYWALIYPGRAPDATEAQSKQRFFAMMNKLRRSKGSRWRTAELIAQALGCAPEDFARRLTQGEWHARRGR